MTEEDEKMKNTISKFMKLGVKFNKRTLEERAELLTLHFIGYFSKPEGMKEKIYKESYRNFLKNRGSFEIENEAVLEILRKYE